MKGLCAHMKPSGNTENWTTIAIVYTICRFSVIFIDWDKELVDAAMDRWAALNEAQEERGTKFYQITAEAHGCNSCFYQIYLCIMALLVEKTVMSRQLSASQKSEGTLTNRLPGKTRPAWTHPPLKPYKTFAEMPLAPTKYIGIGRMKINAFVKLLLS
ncbi:hypothetical protein EDD85DRAFT_798426 [Armillaria nabsnona]|nr:hypothetical protein EDD85DRAFT_798426 [Armillaria nabsnona]